MCNLCLGDGECANHLFCVASFQLVISLFFVEILECNGLFFNSKGASLWVVYVAFAM